MDKEKFDPVRCNQFMSNYCNAMTQTYNARQVFYYPSNVLLAELSVAALKLLLYQKALKQKGEKFASGLEARVLSEEGLLKNCNMDTLLKALNAVAHSEPSISLPGNKGNKIATARAAVVAIMGDLGGMLADPDCTRGTTPKGREKAIAKVMIEVFSTTFGCEAIENAKDLAEWQGSAVVGPKKGKERGRRELLQREGVYRTAPAVDEILLIAKEDVIAPCSWQLADISLNRLVPRGVGAIQEPMIGHMSGSPAEILHIWDSISMEGYQVKTSKKAKLNKTGDITKQYKPSSKEYARAGGASALLVGVGYHSALEVLENTAAYLGQDWRGAIIKLDEDAGHTFYGGAATDLMGELHGSVSSNQSRLRLIDLPDGTWSKVACEDAKQMQ